jgi:pimeloyl-ACP methyl ester carboxylesterase
MKTLAFTFLLLLITAVYGNAQKSDYPFEVSKAGNGNQAIIFIPGFASSGDVWKETIENVKNDYTCYTLTMAGFAGVSPKPGASFRNWETAIVQFIKDQKIIKPVVIGHSMGGGLAMAIAADYPDLPKKIIIVDALPCISAMMNKDFKSNPNNDCSAVVNQITAMTGEQFQQMQKGSIASLCANQEKQEAIVNWSLLSDRTTFAGMYCDFTNTDLRDNIKQIKCPSLVLLESYFTNFKPAIESQYNNLKTAELHYATKGLHFIMFDDTEWYLKQVNDFIKN